ncbi:hypothetical protein [Xenorhabdus anantnagensis]|uniref:Uncharacterized protein n=1 Tax=Xenorhabdus anantnagensis TaxID=3025875 RepID=A0ABT5LZY7_9GAMM|nr:hypothetical protein [Xenorhabdus anantnagensis]MDC9598580.1 hypothetical protein [Xenorhabdus anantnagensis]
MTSVDRTAYPHFNKPLSQKELASCYTLSDDELTSSGKIPAANTAN